MLQDARMRRACFPGCVGVTIIAMNGDFDLGALETVRLWVVGMKDKVHRNEEEVVDVGFVERIRPVVAVLKPINMGGDVRVPR